MNNIRQSNIELLRVISMLLVMLLHAGFLAVGFPSWESYKTNGMSEAVRTLLEFLSMPSVDIFILISGYFGLRPTFKSLSSILFQITVISVLSLIVSIFLNNTTFSLSLIFAILMPLRNGGWFIFAYLGLLLFAPILNTYIEYTDKQKQRSFLIIFFVTQTIMGCFLQYHPQPLFSYGYSVASFIGLYLLGRYVRLNYEEEPIFRLSRTSYGIIILLSLCVLSLSYVFLTYIDFNSWWTHSSGRLHSIVRAYTNPLVLLIAISLLLLFLQLKFYSRWINRIGGSVFSAYLFHDHFLLQGNYIDLFTLLKSNYPPSLYLLVEVLWIVILFALSIVLDQFRLFIWKLIEPMLFKLIKCDQS